MKKENKIKINVKKTLNGTPNKRQDEQLFTPFPSRGLFDYTKWQIDIWTKENIKEIGKTAMVQLIHKYNVLELQ